MAEFNLNEVTSKMTSEHIIQAIAAFEENGYPKGFGRSQKYVLVHADKEFPPPAIFALAIKELTGELPSSKFSVGKGSRSFATLDKCGFEIKQRGS